MKAYFKKFKRGIHTKDEEFTFKMDIPSLNIKDATVTIYATAIVGNVHVLKIIPCLEKEVAISAIKAKYIENNEEKEIDIKNLFDINKLELFLVKGVDIAPYGEIVFRNKIDEKNVSLFLKKEYLIEKNKTEKNGKNYNYNISI